MLWTNLNGLKTKPSQKRSDILIKVGLPEVIAELLAESDSGASQNALFDDRRRLSKLTDRGTTPLAINVTAAM